MCVLNVVINCRILKGGMMIDEMDGENLIKITHVCWGWGLLFRHIYISKSLTFLALFFYGFCVSTIAFKQIIVVGSIPPVVVIETGIDCADFQWDQKRSLLREMLLYIFGSFRSVVV